MGNKIFLICVLILLFQNYSLSQNNDINIEKMFHELNNLKYENFQLKIIYNKVDSISHFNSTIDISISKLILLEKLTVGDTNISIKKSIVVNQKDKIWIQLISETFLQALKTKITKNYNKKKKNYLIKWILNYKDIKYVRYIFSEDQLTNSDYGIIIVTDGIKDNLIGKMSIPKIKIFKKNITYIAN